MNAKDIDQATRLLNDIEAALADLAHIDLAVDARQRFYDQIAGWEPWEIQEAIAGIDLPVGTRYPFEISVYGGIGSEWQANNRAWRAEAEQWARDCVDGVRHASRYLTTVDSERLSRVANSLHAAAADLAIMVPTWLDNEVLKPSEDEWTGDARDSFKNFIAQAITASTHQGWLLEAIRVSLAQAKAVIDMTQSELMHLLGQVAASLDEQLRKRVDEERGAEELIEFLMFASAATGVLSAITLPAAVAGASSLMAVGSPLLGLAKDRVPSEKMDEVRLQRASSYAEHLTTSTQRIIDSHVVHWDRAHADGAGLIAERLRDLETLHGARALAAPMPAMAERPVPRSDFSPASP